MQRNTLFSILATAALGLVMAGPVNAENHKWKASNTNDDYHTAGNWNPTGVPGTGDTATINPFQTPDGYVNPVLDDQDRSLGQLVIGSGFSLTVTGVKLTLEGNSHTLNGNLILSNSDSKVEFTFAQASGWVTLSGSGGIEGQDGSAELRLNDSKIDNDSVIHGMMTVKKVGGDTATFKNGPTGIVRADADGVGSPAVLLLAAGLTVVDANTGTPKWQATSKTDARLRFDVSATGLNGEFTVSECAQLYLADGIDVHTTGNFIFTANDYEVRTDASPTYCFKWNVGGGAPGSICNNVTCP